MPVTRHCPRRWSRARLRPRAPVTSTPWPCSWPSTRRSWAAPARARRPFAVLHAPTDWPGHRPDIARTIAALVRAGADVGVRFEGEHAETPLHWAASNDDLEAGVHSSKSGADIDLPTVA